MSIDHQGLSVSCLNSATCSRASALSACEIRLCESSNPKYREVDQQEDGDFEIFQELGLAQFHALQLYVKQAIA